MTSDMTHRNVVGYERELTIARKNHDRPAEWDALTNMGQAYMQLGDLSRAEHNYQESLSVAREIHNRYLEQGALINLSLVNSTLGNLRTSCHVV